VVAMPIFLRSMVSVDNVRALRLRILLANSRHEKYLTFDDKVASY
jgi:hypothetical protein